MSSLVVVALPEVNDPVWKLSSQKVPHLTLLYLGEADTNPNLLNIVQFVQHAASVSLRRFGLSVDRRGTLGDDQADVLFFDKEWAKDLVNFRHQLLQDPHIRTAYDSTKQFPEWTPHLTLGYPDSPAQPDEREYPIQWVSFDRISVWMGDSTGPEFLLDNNDWGHLAMSGMNTMEYGEEVAGELMHYGVKGMKWGQRKARPTAAQINTARDRLEKKNIDLKAQKRNYKSQERGSLARSREKNKFKDMKAEILRSPDRATALRMTKGEKVTLGILAVVPPTALGAVSTTAIVVGARKATENRAKAYARTYPGKARKERKASVMG